MDGELLRAAQTAVEEGRATSISAWVNDALRLKAEHERRMQALDSFLATYEAEHGVITEDEIDEAVRRRPVTGHGCPPGTSQVSSRGGMTMLLDAGAFVAVERGDRDVVALVKRERLAQRSPLSHGGIVAQISRGGSGRQSEVARLLRGVDVRPLDEELGKKAGAAAGPQPSRGRNRCCSHLSCRRW